MKRQTSNALKKLFCITLALCLLMLFPLCAAAASRGDVDGDGSVTAADARLALRAAVGLEKAIVKGTAAFTAADVDGDGVITAADARTILRIAVKLEDPDGLSGYDILRGSAFYLTGAMTSGGTTSPMKLAVSPDLVYIETAVDGLSLGYLVKDGKTCLVAPEQKIYHWISAAEAAMLKSAGLMDENEVRENVADMGFAALKPLSQADSSASGTFNGTACTVYTFVYRDGSKYRVYMDGARLLALENVNASGITETLLTVKTVSRTIPALPPADYRSRSLVLFITALGAELG